MNFFLLALLFNAPAPPDDASLLAEPTLGAHPQSARSIGMGGALRAVADGIDALQINAAGMSMNRRYVVDGNYAWSQAANAHKAGTGVIDSATTVVGAGLAYNFERRFNSGELDVHRMNFGLSYSFKGIFGIGATFKYLNATRNKYDQLFDPNTQAPRLTIFPYPAQRVLAFTGDLSAILRPIQYFSIAVIGYNLVPNPTWRELTPIALGTGIALHIAGLEADVDAVIDFTTLKRAEVRMHFGAEYAIANVVPLRAGFIWDRIANDMYWSGGIGFRHPSFGIDFGYRQSVQRAVNRTISLGIQYYMN
jgi:opacity protein-like surface antigen